MFLFLKKSNMLAYICLIENNKKVIEVAKTKGRKKRVLKNYNGF